ncbi:MAG: bifunctional folylpolyglutamate synthase/dihydrofolate synthase [Rhodothermales bacterium]|nr:bifunctional folylpolyglutamate synthase/dihydrofolate synthase [Rhodothermales bacterium]
MSDLLDRLPRFATGEPGSYRPGFDRIHALLDLFSRPDHTFEVVLVGGTNGKGSTAAVLSALLTASGRTVGLHTSPHLLDITERMRVDGRAAPRAWLDAALDRFESDILEIGPSFYEATLALSLLYFTDQDVDTAVVEIGLGGRLDAANALDPNVSVITTVGLDHTDILGDSIEKIAVEKAGILRPGVPLVLGRLPEPARDVILERAAESGAPVRSISDVDEIPPTIGLPGRHQVDNARTALAAYEALTGYAPDSDVAERALADVVALSGIRGRMERIALGPGAWVDVAHNVDALEAALHTYLRLTPDADRRVVVFGVLRDKDLKGMAALLVRAGVHAVASGIPGLRARPVNETADALRAAGVPVLEAVANPVQALRRARMADAPVLVTGSHYLVADILRDTGT